MFILPLSTVVLLGLVQFSDGAKNRAPRQPTGQTMNLVRSTQAQQTAEQWGAWAKNQKMALEAKYRPDSSLSKRATGTNSMVNQNGDSSYYGSLAIGTPAVSYNVILDTGSADLWVAGSECSIGCDDVPLFDPSSSSSFQNESTSFSITYGSGQAAGFLSQDVVQMAGFEVKNQIFGICDQVSSGLLTSPVSGLLGLGFQTIASSGATPFWQTLVTENAWDSPLMAFHLTRYLNVSNVKTLEPGGSFSMGFANSSLYTGDIDYVNLPVEGSYWILPITAITVQNNSVTAPSGSESYAAIDTGTTLVGGPPSYIAAIFAQIPGSQAGTGDFESYYTYPCDTDVTVELSFGGNRSWAISSEDFELTRLTRDTCLGAFFELSSSSSGSAPSWIVGDTFLKNVYSVFRYSPASVGFAELSSVAIASNGANAAVPSATIGSTPATVSASGSVSAGARSHNGGKGREYGILTFSLLSFLTVLFMSL